jgi:hypothetical protein
VAQEALRAARGGRALVPGIRLIEVAHVLWTGGEYESQDRLGLAGATAGGHAGPTHCGAIVRVRRFGDAEQVGCAFSRRRRLAGAAVKVDRREQTLSFDVAAICRPLEPTPPFDPARGNSGALDVTTPDAIFRLGKSGAARSGIKPEGPFGLAGGDECGAAAHRRGRREGDPDSLKRMPIFQPHCALTRCT